MNYNNKSFMTKKKAFTLIELLIVIAIIGILFIVLVSKVDFATDKAKATGVQTDFRSFQLAIESVAKENAGFNTFGWDTGDANQNGKRDSYDEGDNGAGGGIAKNGIQDGTEVFTGHKVYSETFTKIFSLRKNGTGSYDRDALNCLETAINANLDPKLHITIKDDGEVVMANGAQDPWNREYHGVYITNAETDGKDRGAIVIYSDGANNEFGSEPSIANGVVKVNIPGNNKLGKDDYSIAVVYTYVNGYGEVKTTTSGFSNNQTTQDNISNNSGIEGTEDPDVTELLEPGLYEAGSIELAKAGDVETAQDMMKTSWNDLLAAGIVHVTDGVVYSNLDVNTEENASSDALDGDLVLPNDGSITSIGDFSIDETYNIGKMAFTYCEKLTGISIPDSVTNINDYAFHYCESLTSVTIPNGVTSIGKSAFYACISLTNIDLPDSINYIGDEAFQFCESLTSIVIPNGVSSIGNGTFEACEALVSAVIPDSVTSIGDYAFAFCYVLTDIDIPDGVTSIGEYAFNNCRAFTNIVIPCGVTSISNCVLQSCYNLESVTILGTVTSIGTSAFSECHSLTAIYVPAEDVNEYKASSGWIKYADKIQAIPTT